MSNVGDMLRLARQRLGFTQKEAAKRLGIPSLYSRVSKMAYRGLIMRF
jgi:transcriptional regulator with XRE-family HTH domain